MIDRRAGAVLLVLLVGITAAFLVLREDEGARRRPPPEERPARPEPPRRLVDLGAPLRGLGQEADAHLTARRLVDAVLDRMTGSARDAILAALGHEDWGVRWAGLLAIPQYGPPDAALADALRRHLDAEVAVVRLTAVEAAAYVAPGDFAGVEPALARAAADERADVRATAIRTLARGTLRRVSWIRLFIDALDDPAEEVRAAGAYGLAQIELQEHLDPDALDDLRPRIEALLREKKTDVVAYAVMALGRMGPRAGPAVPQVIGLLDDPRELVRGQAAAALASIGRPALPHIERALGGPFDERTASLLWALRLMGGPARAVLVRLTEHEHPVLRVLAARKLWELDHEVDRAVAVIVAALEGDDVDALRTAARSLARMGPEAVGALPGLRRHRDHPDETVRQAVDAAIGRLEPLETGGKGER